MPQMEILKVVEVAVDAPSWIKLPGETIIRPFTSSIPIHGVCVADAPRLIPSAASKAGAVVNVQTAGAQSIAEEFDEPIFKLTGATGVKVITGAPVPATPPTFFRNPHWNPETAGTPLAAI